MKETDDSYRGPGYVYLIRHQNSNGLHKIGRTIKPDSRMNQLGGEGLDIIAIVLCTDAIEVEKQLHRKYSSKRLPQSEWFNLSQEEVRQVQSRLEEVFSEGRRYIKLDGKHLPTLSQVRGKDKRIEQLEASNERLKKELASLEDTAKKQSESIERLRLEIDNKLGIISQQRHHIDRLLSRSKTGDEEFGDKSQSDIASEKESKEPEIKEPEIKESEDKEMHHEGGQEKWRGYWRNTMQKNSDKKAQPRDPWDEVKCTTNIDTGSSQDASDADTGNHKRLKSSGYYDEYLFNRTHNPEKDKAFLKAWNLRWFNRRYRPRLDDD